MKPKVHRYYLPRVLSANHREVDSWSVWLVDEDTGTLVIFGDRGTWSHTWGHSGRCEEARHDFRLELLQFGPGYIGNKLSYGAARVLNEHKTIEAVKEWILSARRDSGYSLSAKKARRMWRHIGSVVDEHEWREFLEEHDDGLDLWELAVYEPHNAAWLEHLMGVTLPRFKSAIRRELFRESSHRWFRKHNHSAPEQHGP